jgi:hypothetical protein
MMRPSGRRQRFRSTFPEQSLDPEPLCADRAKVEVQGFGAGAWDHDEVHTRRQELGKAAKNLAAKALDAVSLHRVSEAAAHDEAEACGRGRPRLPGLPRGDEKREVRGPDTPGRPVVLGGLELSVFSKPLVRSEAIAHGPAAPGRRSRRSRYFL